MKNLNIFDIKKMHEAANPGSLFFKGEVIPADADLSGYPLNKGIEKNTITKKEEVYYSIVTNRPFKMAWINSVEFFHFHLDRPDYLFDSAEHSERWRLKEKLVNYGLIFECNEDVATHNYSGFFEKVRPRKTEDFQIYLNNAIESTLKNIESLKGTRFYPTEEEALKWFRV